MSSELVRTMALMVLDGEPDAEIVYLDAAMEQDGDVVKEIAKSVKNARRILRDHLQVQKTIRFFDDNDNMQYIEKTKNFAIAYHVEGSELTRIDVRSPGKSDPIVRLFSTTPNNDLAVEGWSDATIVPGVGVVNVKTWSYIQDEDGNRTRRPATLGSKLILPEDVVEHIRQRAPEIRADVYLKFMAAGVRLQQAAEALTKRRK